MLWVRKKKKSDLDDLACILLSFLTFMFLVLEDGGCGTPDTSSHKEKKNKGPILWNTTGEIEVGGSIYLSSRNQTEIRIPGQLR